METSHRLNSLPAWMAFEETLQLMDALSVDGYEAPRFVGGCVRDVLVNRTVYDIDLATPMPAEKIMENLQKAEIKAIPTGIDHGTVTAVLNKRVFEITTLRKDIETDGRHATVEFTDNWEEDAKRRDFTMNALFCDIEGNIYDFHNGVQDLHAGHVQFIGDASARISEDVLRILRFFRFYAHYGVGAADKTALEACRAQAAEIPNLSKERITTEFLRMMEARNAAAACGYMAESHVLAQITEAHCQTRDLEKLIMLEEKWDTHYDVMRRIAVFMGGTSLLFCLSKVQEKQLKTLTDKVVLDKVWADMSDFAIRQFVYERGHDVLRDVILLTAARDMAQEEKYLRIYQEATKCRLPRMPVIGDDVLELGIETGTQVGKYLRAVETWWRDKDFRPGRTECLTYLRSIDE